MIHPTTEAERCRVREDEIHDRLSQLDQTSAIGAPSLVAQTTTITSYPSAARQFYACRAQTVLGKEVEGGAGTLTPNPSLFLALNLGTVVPPVGTTILATFVDSRWVFRHDG